MHRTWSGLILAFLLLGFASNGASQALSEVERARDAHAFARSIMSPFCPGRTLTDCPSPDAAALREEIRQLLRAGVSEEAIRSELENRFGGAVVAEPRGVWARIIPLSILGAGLVALVVVLRNLSARRPAPDASASSDLARELDADLDSRGL